MRVLSAITAPDVARQILERLGVAPAAPLAARARDPTWAEWSQTELPGVRVMRPDGRRAAPLQPTRSARGARGARARQRQSNARIA